MPRVHLTARTRLAATSTRTRQSTKIAALWAATLFLFVSEVRQVSMVGPGGVWPDAGLVPEIERRAELPAADASARRIPHRLAARGGSQRSAVDRASPHLLHITRASYLIVSSTVHSLNIKKDTEGGQRIMPGGLSIQTYARIGGVLFLVSLVAGGFGEGFVPSQLIATGDAAATTRHIFNSDALFRVGFASYLVEALCDVALTVTFYVLLRPVNQIVTFGIVLFRVMATATFAFAELFYFAPSLIVGNDTYLKSFSPDQLNTLTLLSLNLYGVGGVISLVFYGVASIGIGYLMFRSGYFPRILGVLWVIGGAGFVLRTFAYVLVPNVPTVILQVPQILAILVLAVWLLAKGVNAAKWEARAQPQSPVLLS